MYRTFPVILDKSHVMGLGIDTCNNQTELKFISMPLNPFYSIQVKITETISGENFDDTLKYT